METPQITSLPAGVLARYREFLGHLEKKAARPAKVAILEVLGHYEKWNHPVPHEILEDYQRLALLEKQLAA